MNAILHAAKEACFATNYPLAIADHLHLYGLLVSIVPILPNPERWVNHPCLIYRFRRD